MKFCKNTGLHRIPVCSRNHARKVNIFFLNDTYQAEIPKAPPCFVLYREQASEFDVVPFDL
jgi:hypothetical protein